LRAIVFFSFEIEDNDFMVESGRALSFSGVDNRSFFDHGLAVVIDRKGLTVITKK
jgi:hypothetical protein